MIRLFWYTATKVLSKSEAQGSFRVALFLLSMDLSYTVSGELLRLLQCMETSDIIVVAVRVAVIYKCHLFGVASFIKLLCPCVLRTNGLYQNSNKNAICFNPVNPAVSYFDIQPLNYQHAQNLIKNAFCPLIFGHKTKSYYWEI